MSRSNSLPSRLERRPSRTARVKDAGRDGTGARRSVRDLADRLRAPRCVVLSAALILFLVPAVNAASAQAAGPEWKLTVTPSADYFPPDTAEIPDEDAFYTIEAENVGNQSTSEAAPIVLEDVLPPGLGVFPGSVAETVSFYSTALGLETNIQQPTGRSLSQHGLCPTSLRCEFPGPGGGVIAPGEGVVPPHQRLIMLVRVDVPSGLIGPIEDLAKVSGGGAAAVEAGATNEVDPDPPLGFHRFAAPLEDSSSSAYTHAGGHPDQFNTEMDFATRAVLRDPVLGSWGELGSTPVADPRDIAAELPPGLIGDPQAVPRCSLAAFFSEQCPISTIVGNVGVRTGITAGAQGAFTDIVPLFNLQPAGSYPGELGYRLFAPFFITAALRSGSDYGLTLTNEGTPPVGLNRAYVTTWGVPADHEHDALRGKICNRNPLTGGSGPNWAQEFVQLPAQAYRDCELSHDRQSQFHDGGPAGVPPTPFLTMPTDCTGESLTIGARYDTWQLGAAEASTATTDPPVDGCNALKFEPAIEARPTTDLADSPSGFEFNLKVPQGCWKAEETPGFESLCQADLKEATVKLPPGLVVNPSSGAGLEGCSPAQIGLATPVATAPAHFSEVPAACPDASKLGTVEVDTPLLHNPLLGSVYLATPHQNPSGNLLAGYIVLEGEGVIIKLAGQFQTDPQTGQITASFTENPQTPFEEFKFHFFAGARGALRTPSVCGSYEVGSTLTPWSAPESGPPAEPTSEFETTAGPTGGACPASTGGEPHAFVLHAGTESTQAGAYSPFSLKLVRSDGEQEIKQVETTLPEGLVGRLAGTTYCPDSALAAAAGRSGVAEQQSPSCPASSQVGTVDVASGAGPTPLHVPGNAYLAGPYKGAPLSLAIITPAVTGPFDLGTVVVRTALYVDPLTTQITAKSDPIPTILEGIPLDVRQITLQMSRPDFTLNPTDCEPKQITGTALTALGASTSLDQRFQVGGCPALAFKPKLAIKLKGGTKRHTFPALTATLRMPPGGANIASAQVTLPHSAFLEQGHIKTVCTRPQLASHSCPAASVYGHAKAVSPLLEKPLEGPVYLGTGFGYKLPALVADLNGQIEVLLDGKVDTGRADGLRNTFEVVPDAPVSSFTLSMFGGKKGLIVNSENLCGPKAKTKALVSFTAQSGKTAEFEPSVANSCKKKHGGHKRGHGKSGHRVSGAGSRSRMLALLPRGW